MLKIRFRLPKGQSALYRHLDLVHDALVAALIANGAEASQVLGPSAAPWNFAALGRHEGHQGHCHTLVVATPDPALTRVLSSVRPEQIRYARAITDESLEFGNAERIEIPDPILPGQEMIGALLLSPLVVRDRGSGRWHTRLDAAGLSQAISARLGRIAGRTVDLRLTADSLYLRAHPRHSVLVSLKADSRGRRGFVIGMQAPVVLAGSGRDLRLAWFAGIGEKTRNGFGCLGLPEDGIGR